MVGGIPSSSSTRRQHERRPSVSSAATGGSASAGGSHKPHPPRSSSRSRHAHPEDNHRDGGRDHLGHSRDGGGGRDDRGRESSAKDSRSSSRPKSRRAPSVGRSSKEKKQYDTPFDAKGRCHHHANIQLVKKKLTGGWKILLERCPKCLEDDYIDNNCDNKSVRSTRSGRSSRSIKSSRSVRSTRSSRSISGDKSTSGGTVRSSSKGKGKGLPSVKKYSPKFECPFDDQGYCHQHSNVRLAKKKLTGGWKILQEFCTECAKDDQDEDHNTTCGKSVCSRSSKRSTRSRVSASQRSEVGETSSELSTSQSEVMRKKVVKKMAYTDDENGEEGLYTGYVNLQYKPHGRGKMVYNDGGRYDGTWSEGTKVHGKTTAGKSSSKGKVDNGVKKERESSGKAGSSGGVGGGKSSGHGSLSNRIITPEKDKEKDNQSLREYRELYQAIATQEKKKVVKSMKFIDFYGDPGRYSGEVNDQQMPHGMGEITYDHGLVQGGNWTNGILDEGSIISMPKSKTRTNAASSRKLVPASLPADGNSRVSRRVRDP